MYGYAGGQLLHPTRIVVAYNPRAKQWFRALTNLPRSAFSAQDILQLYALRWQIELLFKELKSHANLHRFVTRKRHIAEGLIWGSLAAVTLKRFLAHACQSSHQSIAISIRKVASSALAVLGEVLSVVGSKTHIIKVVLARVFRFLTHNARRTNPAWERQYGRLRPGLCIA